MNIESVGSVAAAGATVVFLAGYVAFVVAAFVKAYRDRGISENARLIWLVGIVVVPLLGALGWFLLGNQTSRVERYVRTLLC